MDAAVQTAPLETAIKRHPKMALAKVKAKYWYQEADSRYCYMLPDDKSVRVVRLTDTVLLTLKKPITQSWKHYQAQTLLCSQHERSITLTFQ